jgi:uncharacterized oxidoreductase
MNISGNTILVTGGATGIGLGLAKALQAEGNTVIIAGRRKKALDKAVKENAGLVAVQLDVTDPASIRSAAEKVDKDCLALNILINCAGIMLPENIIKGDNADVIEKTIETNILGTIRMNQAFLPHLLKQKDATIFTVSSGLGFVPLAVTPTYSASKAFIHSYSESLRFQLEGTSVKVIEIAPPGVAQTELMGRDPSSPAEGMMPLADFISEVMDILKSKPDTKEVCVKEVEGLRFAEATGRFDATFRGLNEQFRRASH